MPADPDRDVRLLVADLAREHAVILSTHLLAEVQRAVERDLEIRSVPDVAGLIAEIEAEASRTDGDAEPRGEAP